MTARTKTAALLGLTAALLRALVLAWRHGHDPLFHQPLNDALIYDQWARAIQAGGSFGSAGAPYYLPPLYPYLVAGLRAFGGDFWPVTIFQGVGGVATVLGIWRLGRRLHGDRAGLFAGILALLFAPLLWYEGWLLPASLNVLLLVVAGNLAVDCHTRLRHLWLGAVLGLAAVLRTENLLLLAGLLAWFGWRRRRDLAAAWPPLAITLLAGLAVIAPVTVHNLRVSGEPVLISANGGVNFYLGNFAGADGRFALPDGFTAYIDQQQEASRVLASRREGRELNWSETSRSWVGAGLRELHPVRLGWRKLRLLVAWREWENNFLVSWVHQQTGLAKVLIPSLGLLWLLALPALLRAVRRPAADGGPLVVLFAVVGVTCLLFWVSARNRLPLVIPLAVWAGASLDRWRDWRRPALAVATALLAVLVVWPTGEQESAAFHVDLGGLYAQHGEIVKARTAFRDALALDARNPMAINGLALTYMEVGDRATAISMLRELISSYPDFKLARQNLQAILNAPPEPAQGIRR